MYQQTTIINKPVKVGTKNIHKLILSTIVQKLSTIAPKTCKNCCITTEFKSAMANKIIQNVNNAQKKSANINADNFVIQKLYKCSPASHA